MKAAISGSRGVIGTRLREVLESQGVKVFPITRITYYNSELLSKFFRRHKPDWIFHLATFGNMIWQTDLNQTILANVLGTARMLQCAMGYKAFVNVSSSSTLLDNDTFYSATKLCSEKICNAYTNMCKKPIVNVRLSTVIGKGEQPEHLIPKLIKSCKTEEKMLFVGSPTHDFIDIRDAVKGLIAVAKNANQLIGKSVNISNNNSYTNFEVKNIVERLLHKKANIFKVSALRSYDTSNWRIDNSELLKLGWKPKYTLAQSIRSMIH